MCVAKRGSTLHPTLEKYLIFCWPACVTWLNGRTPPPPAVLHVKCYINLKYVKWLLYNSLLFYSSVTSWWVCQKPT